MQLVGRTVSMQTITEYKSEHKAVKASIGRMHAEIWRLGAGQNAGHLRREIDALGRRLKTIDYLVCWLRKQANDSP